MLLEFSAAVAVTILYSFACLSLGARLLNLLNISRKEGEPLDPIAGTGSAFLLGQGVLAALWVVVSLAGWFSLSVVLGISVAAGLSGIRLGWELLVRLIRRFRAALAGLRAEGWPLRIVALLTLLLVVMTSLSTFLPPEHRGDALAFYLAQPRLISATEHLTLLPGYEGFARVGLQAEFHYAALVTLNGPTAAKLIMGPISLAGALLFLALGGQAGLGRHGKWIALTALYTSTAFTTVIGDGKVDLLGAALGLAAFYWAWQAVPRWGAPELSLTGLLAGLAVVAKISYLPVLPPGLLLLVVWKYLREQPAEARFSRGGLRALLGGLIWLGVWAALALLPHVLKSTVLFNDPLAPFLGSQNAWLTDQVWFSPATTRRIIFLYPFALVYGQFWAQAGDLSPLFLAFLPLALAMSRPRSLLHSRLLPVVLAGAVGVLVWMIYRPSIFAPRYILTALLVLLLVGARAAEGIIQPGSLRPIWLRTIIWASLLVALGGEITRFEPRTANVIHLATGQQSECDMEVLTSDASCRIARILSDQMAPGDRVMIGSYYTYWLRIDTLECMYIDGMEQSLAYIPSVEERWAFLIEQNVHYLVIDRLTHAYLMESLTPDNPPDWLDIEVIYDGSAEEIVDNEFMAYRFESRDPAYQPRTVCLQTHPPVWELTPVQAP